MNKTKNILCPNCEKYCDGLYTNECYNVIHCGCFHDDTGFYKSSDELYCINYQKDYCELDNNCSNLNKNKYYLTLNNKYVGNCLLFYKNDDHGYTCNVNEAKQFSYLDALYMIKTMKNKYLMWKKNYIDLIIQSHVHSDYIDNNKAIKQNENN